MQIEFAPTFPVELRKPVERLVRAYAPHFCRTVDSLLISFDDQKDSAARILVQHSYRWASISLAANWAKLSPQEREGVIVHELSHIPLTPLYTAMEAMVEELPSEEARRMATKWLEEALEAATQDVSRAVLSAHRRHP
jgi:hypothetical protein